jgi:hypothetical protein
VEKKGTTRSNVYPKVLREGRDLKMLLLQKKKNTSKEGGDVYLDSSRRNIEHEAWLVDSGASFHMTPHRDWFFEYERYDGGDFFLGDDSTTKIIGKKKSSWISWMEGLEHSMVFFTS